MYQYCRILKRKLKLCVSFPLITNPYHISDIVITTFISTYCSQVASFQHSACRLEKCRRFVCITFRPEHHGHIYTSSEQPHSVPVQPGTDCRLQIKNKYKQNTQLGLHLSRLHGPQFWGHQLAKFDLRPSAEKCFKIRFILLH